MRKKMKALNLLVGLAIFHASAVFAQSASDFEECLDSQVRPCFTPVRPDRFKALVLEFIETGQSTLGHSLSRLVWREVRELTTDIRGTVVVLVHNQSNFGSVRTKNPILSKELDGVYSAEFVTSEMLRANGHVAANQIGLQSAAEIVVWGYALNVGEMTLVQPNITLPSFQGNRTWRSLALKGDGIDFDFPLPSERLNFPEISLPRNELFQREFMVRCNRSTNCPGGVELKAAPSISSSVLGRVPRGNSVSVSNAVNQWLQVERDGKSGYMNIYHVELTPANLVFDDVVVVGRSAPSENADIVFEQRVSGTIPVVGIAKDAKNFEDEHIADNWYKISVSNKNFWLQGARRNYGTAMPSSLFVAALYRFQAGQYRQANELLQRYLFSDPNADPKILSSAYRLASISAYQMGSENANLRATLVENAVSLAKKSIDALPFDTAGYLLLGAIQTNEGDWEAGAESVRNAIELNQFDPYLGTFLSKYCKVAHRADVKIDFCTN